MTVLNSNFEEWQLKNPEGDYRDFKFKIEKMGKSGALFDLEKLCDVSKTEISKLSAEECYGFLNGWVQEFGTEKDKAHFKDKDYRNDEYVYSQGKKISNIIFNEFVRKGTI